MSFAMFWNSAFSKHRLPEHRKYLYNQSEPQVFVKIVARAHRSKLDMLSISEHNLDRR
jgi:hypothetical protein